MSESASPRLALVIPVYNERESLPQLLSEIDAVKTEHQYDCMVLLIDDGSRDGSWDEIVELSRKYPYVNGIRFRNNFGKAAALAAGFQYTDADIVMTLDADLQDDPKEIPRFLDVLNQGYDVVSGWKKVRHDPWHKVFPSRVFNAMVSKATGVKLHDHNCGFKAYRGAVVKEVRLYGELHRFVPVLAANRGFKVGELVVHHRARQHGHSKYGVKRFLKGFIDLVSVRFVTQFGHRPAHYFGTMAVVPLLLGTVGIITLIVSGIISCTTDYGLSLYSSVIIMMLSLALLLLASQLLLTGLVTELIVFKHAAHGPHPYAISETTQSLQGAD